MILLDTCVQRLLRADFESIHGWVLSYCLQEPLSSSACPLDTAKKPAVDADEGKSSLNQPKQSSERGKDETNGEANELGQHHLFSDIRAVY